MGKIRSIIIVGAGPSGLVLALLLAKEKINVTLVDMAPQLDSSPRATHYSWPAVYELQRAGVIDEVVHQGFKPGTISWRKLDGSLLGSIHNDNVPWEKQMVCLPLNHLTKILLEHLAKEDTARILWSHKVTKLGQSESKAWIVAETDAKEVQLEADYIVGCDGANSQVRRSLFGDWEFPGKTWDEQIVATNTYFDMSTTNWGDDSSFLVDPEHWAMIAKIQTDGLLRITYGDIPGLTRDEYIKRQPMKFKAFLPGNPDPDKYKVVNISPYKIHQRLADSLRVGRFLLAADAAHLCNPFGGLGLTGGLVDVGNLYDCFSGINRGVADDSILDRYSEVRRQKYNDIINPISSDNIRRLWKDSTAADQDQFYYVLKKANTDPALSRQLQEGLNSVMHDFTKEYNASSE